MPGAPTVDPDRNFVADMDLASLLVDPQRCLVRVPVTDAVLTPNGDLPLGLLMTLVDVGASDPALVACRPDWTATQDLSISSAAWVGKGPVVADCRLVRVGSRVVIVTADVYDGQGVEDFDALQNAIDAGPDGGATLVARSLVTFARLRGSAATGVDDYHPARWLGEVRRRPRDRPAEGSLYERMGLQVVDASSGRAELARSSYVANSIGTINGGAQALLVGAAAEAMCPGQVAADMQLHYLSQVKAGPARSSARLLRAVADHSVVAVELVDAGNDDQLLALATVTLRTRA